MFRQLRLTHDGLILLVGTMMVMLAAHASNTAEDVTEQRVPAASIQGLRAMMGYGNASAVHQEAPVSSFLQAIDEPARLRIVVPSSDDVLAAGDDVLASLDMQTLGVDGEEHLWYIVVDGAAYVLAMNNHPDRNDASLESSKPEFVLYPLTESPKELTPSGLISVTVTQ